MENQHPAIAVRPSRRPGWRQAVLFTGALLGGLLAGAGGISYAAMLTGGVDWRYAHRLSLIQRHVREALDAVGASSIQEDKSHDIIATGLMPIDDGRDARAAMRKQMIALLRAPTIDRTAVEKLRADEVARFDARSKTMTGMILDSAAQLSPEQRAALADKAEAMMAHHREGWHRWSGPRDDSPADGTQEMRGHGQEEENGPEPEGMFTHANPG